eukprot:GHVU01110380.1.p1 GENE.GHVU01110380.1~~GHVU01110380.1.p1  ORF type:complete len:176 (+),score=2.30 GHVU01110380.1:584-1111(+)
MCNCTYQLYTQNQCLAYSIVLCEHKIATALGKTASSYVHPHLHACMHPSIDCHAALPSQEVACDGLRSYARKTGSEQTGAAPDRMAAVKWVDAVVGETEGSHWRSSFILFRNIIHSCDPSYGRSRGGVDELLPPWQQGPLLCHSFQPCARLDLARIKLAFARTHAFMNYIYIQYI